MYIVTRFVDDALYKHTYIVYAIVNIRETICR